MVWFKNLQLFKFAEPFTRSPEDLAEALAAQAFRPCGDHQPSSRGWVSPLGEDGGLVHAVGACSRILLRREQKNLPASVIKRRAAERAEQIAAREARPVGRKERRELEQAIALELLPQAFTTLKETAAYIDPEHGWIGVDTRSRKQAEEFLSFLRQTLGSLPVKPFATRVVPGLAMTEWLRSGSVPGAFVAGGDCDLRDPLNDGGSVKCKNQDLFSEEVRNHLEQGKEVTRLALSWGERLGFLVDEELGISRMKFLDLLADELGEQDAEDRLAAMDGEFALMCGEFARLVPELLAAFGGDAEAAEPAPAPEAQAS